MSTEQRHKKRAVFLDRDGVINKEKNYAHRVQDLELIPRAVEAIKLLNANDFLVVVVTNQAGIAYGYYTEHDMHAFNNALQDELRKGGAHIDSFYFCPHHKEKGAGIYRVDCDCRKPKSGLLRRAVRDFGVDSLRSFAVGDTWNDIAAGASIGCKTILVRTGHGREEMARATGEHRCDCVADDLYGAVNYILGL